MVVFSQVYTSDGSGKIQAAPGRHGQRPRGRDSFCPCRHIVNHPSRLCARTVADTIAKSFLLAVETRGDRPAIREKYLGVWQSTSWREWLEKAREIAYALDAIGFKPGDVASIVSNATPEWVYADIGVLCAGGVSSGIYPTTSRARSRICSTIPGPR